MSVLRFTVFGVSTSSSWY